MKWKERVNALLSSTIGYQITRPPGHREWRMPSASGRLLKAPVFVLSAPRSGSTLLRVVLGSHSRLFAPPELPLMHLSVRAETKWIKTSIKALQLTQEELDYMLWDRVLGDPLMRSAKPTLVAKTPSNVLLWPRLAECWPDARFIFLLRHPASVVASLHSSWDPQWHPGDEGTLDETVGKVVRYVTKVEEARQALPGHTVRYEELTAEPEKVIRGVCDFLGEEYEPSMLDYGKFPHARFGVGLGDASTNIRSGRIQPGKTPPDLDIPPELAEICTIWGYSQADQAGGGWPPDRQPDRDLSDSTGLCAEVSASSTAWSRPARGACGSTVAEGPPRTDQVMPTFTMIGR
jgi:Sulfotransferase family